MEEEMTEEKKEQFLIYFSKMEKKMMQIWGLEGWEFADDLYQEDIKFQCEVCGLERVHKRYDSNLCLRNPKKNKEVWICTHCIIWNGDFDIKFLIPTLKEDLE